VKLMAVAYIVEHNASITKEGERLSIFNLKVLTTDDFTIYKDPVEMLEEDATDESIPSDLLPVKLTNDGMRKFITQFERKMVQKVKHHLTGQHLTYRDCIREQIRHFARYLRGEEPAYQAMPLR